MYLLVTCLYPVTKLVLSNWLGVTKQGQGSIGGWDGMGWVESASCILFGNCCYLVGSSGLW